MSPSAGPSRASTPPLRLLFRGEVHRLSPGGNGRLISVIVPVKNSAADLPELLGRVLAQRGKAGVEIIAVDSGSSDDTVNVLRVYGATVFEVDPREFNYGLTRNLAARHAGGSVLVFLTTRAQPADDRWLANLLAPLDSDPRVAGVCSRVLPRLDADLLTARDQLRIRHPGRRVSEITDWSTYRLLEPHDLRQFIAFPNVSAAIQAEVLARIPFPHVAFGEDIKWAKEVLEAGLKLQYEPSSIVLHSHNYSEIEWFQRSFDDGGANYDIAGIRLDAAGVTPTILSMVSDDWHYFEEGWHLESAELRHWQLQSVFRRTAWALGRWLGTNRQLLVGGLPVLVAAAAEITAAEGARGEPYGEIFRRGLQRGSRGAASSELPLDDGAIVNRLISTVDAEWSQLEQETSTISGERKYERMDAALRQIAEKVGLWLGANQHRFTTDLQSRLSLIEQVKGGLITLEMKGAMPGRPGLSTCLPYPAVESTRNRPVTGRWQADTDALEAALTAHEAELAAFLSCLGGRDQRIAELQAELHTKVGERDGIIRGLQSELHSKVAECNQIIGSLQGELQTKVHERDLIIGDLQSELHAKLMERDRVIADLQGSLEAPTGDPISPRLQKPGGTGPDR